MIYMVLKGLNEFRWNYKWNTLLHFLTVQRQLKKVKGQPEKG